jgi:hypothetical protein
MNDNGKLPHSVAAAVASWLALLVGWLESHVALIASLFAIAAATYSIWASRETIKLRRAQRQHLHDPPDQP